VNEEPIGFVDPHTGTAWHFGSPGKDSGLAIEHEIQRQMLERLGIEWTPGEPFYSLIEGKLAEVWAEVEQLRAIRERQLEQNEALLTAIERLRAWQKEAGELISHQLREIERLRRTLTQIENWVGKVPSNLGEAALVFEYIRRACEVLGLPKDHNQHD
jgi:cell fate (sporulation/competence/biofilm development) regulator YmcA (YheA/YmcA/DUF963 family)